MARIKLSGLSVSKAEDTALQNGYVYKDLLLPIDNRVSYNNQLNKSGKIHDIQGLYDLQAIENSITNCFLTAPGQKILNPEFGIDLRQFLFSPIDDFQSIIIRELISRRLPEMEPRIALQHVRILASVDIQKYTIILEYDVQSLDMYGITQRAILNSNGYTIATE